MRVVCYTDDDRDGFAPEGASTLEACSCPDGTTSVSPAEGDVDCDDGSSSRSPSVVESCNAVDDDCDDAIDEGLPLVSRYEDGPRPTSGRAQ